MEIRDLVLKLNDIEAIKFGSFTLKSGIESPIYLDLRLIVSYPLILKAISEAMWEKIKGVQLDLLCGVPYTAMPIATAISISRNIPMVLRRKEEKNYGTKKMIEGRYHAGQHCVIVEDTVTSGSSIIETMLPLQSEGLVVKDAVVLIDREQGGRENLAKKNLVLHSVMTLSFIIDTLTEAKLIEADVAMKVKEFMHQNRTVPIS